jgi:aspartate racemase
MTMATIGLLGGMSWPSTALYYRLLNEAVRDTAGGAHSAPIVLWSLDFAAVLERQQAGDLAGETELLVDGAARLERAGAACVAICSNAMHRCADAVQRSVGIPLVHIVDTMGDRLADGGHRTVGVLGTRLTMEHGFYAERLRERSGIGTLVPDEADRARVERLISEELGRGIVRADAQRELAGVVERLAERGAEATVLACTSLSLGVDAGLAPTPVYDSTAEHVQALLRVAA